MWRTDDKSLDGNNMKNSIEKKELEYIEKIKKFLVELGFVCNSYPSAQNLVYSKNKTVVIIKNKFDKKEK